MLISSMMSLDREEAELAWVGNWVGKKKISFTG